MADLTPEQIFQHTEEFLKDLDYSDEAKAIAWAIKHYLELDCSGVNGLICDVKTHLENLHKVEYEKLNTLYKISKLRNKKKEDKENFTPLQKEWQDIRKKFIEILLATKDNTNLLELCTKYKSTNEILKEFNYGPRYLYRCLTSQSAIPSELFISKIKLFVENYSKA